MPHTHTPMSLHISNTLCQNSGNNGISHSSIIVWHHALCIPGRGGDLTWSVVQTRHPRNWGLGMCTIFWWCFLKSKIQMFKFNKTRTRKTSPSSQHSRTLRQKLRDAKPGPATVKALDHVCRSVPPRYEWWRATWATRRNCCECLFRGGQTPPQEWAHVGWIFRLTDMYESAGWLQISLIRVLAMHPIYVYISIDL